MLSQMHSLLGVRKVKQAFSYNHDVNFMSFLCQRYDKSKQMRTMPPYGKDGGRTSTSYTPNLYGGTIVSSIARKLPQKSIQASRLFQTGRLTVQYPP